MKPPKSKQRLLIESIILAGVGLILLYWLIDALIYAISDPAADFSQRLIGSGSVSLWTRVILLCLFVALGTRVHFMAKQKRENADQLKESEKKYRSIVQGMEEGYFEVDLGGRLTFVNEALSRMAGVPGEKLLGMGNRDFMSKETAARIYHTFNQIYLAGTPQYTTNFEIIRPDGKRLILEMSASLIRDSAGKPSGFKGVARDVSERVRTETEKRKLDTQIQQAQKMEAIGTLASGIAHDFNNIMMGILGNASLMLAKIEDNHPHHQKLRSIEKYIESGSELTKQLLGFARGGKYVVKPTDLEALVITSARMFGRTAKEIRINTDHLAATWPVEVDQGQMEQVLLNLFVNARQAMPEGGDIYLRTANVELSDGSGMPFRVEPGRYVQISVVDTGIGMSPEVQKRIFEPFFTTKEMGRGTGLGLASTYGIIKNHGGYINVSSELGKGSTFDIYLPASRKTPSRQMPQPATDAVEKGTETVLLVDDEHISLEVGEEILRELGYSVLTARGGREAVEIYREHGCRIDLVVLDMIMPDMGGGRTFDALRALNPDVKVLLASGYSLSGEASKILERGCNDFIQKPFNMKQLSDKIRGILFPMDGRSAAAEN